MKNKILCFCFVVLLSCDTDSSEPNQKLQNLELLAVKEIVDSSGNRYEVGYDQVSSINQDPFVRKFDPKGELLWQVRHESTPVDSRAVWVNLDKDQNPWVVFTVDGGSNNDNFINRKELDRPDAFSQVFQSGYGSGGGPKISILAKLNPENGKIIRGTFIGARLNSGNTNTLNVTSFGILEGQPILHVHTAAWPSGVGRQYQRFPDITDADRIDGAFRIAYIFSPDLSEILSAVLIKE